MTAVAEIMENTLATKGRAFTDLVHSWHITYQATMVLVSVLGQGRDEGEGYESYARAVGQTHSHMMAELTTVAARLSGLTEAQCEEARQLGARLTEMSCAFVSE